MAGSVTLISGHRIGPYEVTGMIGAGGMGEVYRAHDSRLNRDVALKVLARSITRTSPRSMAWRRTRAIADRARRWCLNSGTKKILPILATSALLLGSVSTANAQITFDLRFGQPPPSPRAYHVPPQPGPDYEWIEGYWYPQGSHYVWHNGYWTRPPYVGAYWVDPYYQRGQYFAGHWEGHRGNIFHDHRWDRSGRRDERREPRHTYYDSRRR